MATLIRSHPLFAYSVLAFVFSIALTLLLNVSLVFGLLALFGPAAAALIVSRPRRSRRRDRCDGADANTAYVSSIGRVSAYESLGKGA